jgi:heme exporter protein B
MFLEVTKKDLLSELRSKTVVSLMLLFSLTSAFLFSVSVPAAILSKLLVPLLLVIFFFTGVLGYSISFLREFDTGTIEGLKSSPLSPQEIVLGKILFNVILMFSVQIPLLPICYALFDVEGDFFLLFAIFSICNTSLAVAISSIAPLASKSRARELLIPVLLFPISFPIIVSTVVAANAALSGVMDLTSTVFVAAYSGIILSISLLVSEYML